MQARRAHRRLGERVITLLLWGCGLLSLFITVSIVVVLLQEAVGFFREVSLLRFLTEREWTPLFAVKRFGILPLLSGTLLTTLLAMGVALPLGLLVAIYLSEYAREGFRRLVKPVLEVLAGIPSVVYGYFALTFLSPVLKEFFFPQMGVLNALSAGVVMGFMILPMVSSLSEDALLAVPRSLREGAYALGARRYQVVLRVVLPSAIGGVVSATLLAVARALGETMVVAIAAGSQPRLTFHPLEAVQTMTAYMVQVGLGDIPRGTLEYKTLFAVGLALFALTLLFVLSSQWVVRRWRWEFR